MLPAGGRFLLDDHVIRLIPDVTLLPNRLKPFAVSGIFLD